MSKSTHRNSISTMEGPFRYALAWLMLVTFDLRKYGDEVLQVFSNRRNLMRSVLHRFPEIVKLDASFSKLESNRDDSYAWIQLAASYKTRSESECTVGSY
jgi:hypothetical protein